jgi:hypothetical protein
MTGNYQKPPDNNAGWLSRRSLVWLTVVVLIGLGIWWIVTLTFSLLVGFDDAPGEWSMIIYYNRTDRTKFIVTPRFKTFSYCRESAIEQMKELQIDKIGDYECGFRCKTNGDPHKMNVCQEIRK